MCIAIYKPAGKSISKATLQACFDNNNDGCGFAYVDQLQIPNTIKIFKNMEFAPFYEAYIKATTDHPNSNFIIHFRITSHGTTELFNCHPFMIDDNHVFIHNGIIGSVPRDKRKSDTQMFNETILQLLPYEWFKSEGIKLLLEDFIGASKLIILNINNKVVIYNEKKGAWVDGCWFSNTSYKARAVTHHYSDYGYGYNYHNNNKPYKSKKKLDISNKQKCALCNMECDSISMFNVKQDSYVCYDCMEIIDNCEPDILELNFLQIVGG